MLVLIVTVTLVTVTLVTVTLVTDIAITLPMVATITTIAPTISKKIY